MADIDTIGPKNLNIKKQELRMATASVQIQSYEIRILEMDEEKKRILENIDIQKGVIEDSRMKIEEFKENKNLKK